MEYIDAEFIGYQLQYLNDTLNILAVGFADGGSNKEAEGVCCVLETYVTSLMKEVEERKKYFGSIDKM